MEQLNRLKQFLKLDRDNTRLWLDAMHLAVSHAMWSDAKEIADLVMPSSLDNAEVNGLLGHVLLVHKDYDRALAHLEKALTLEFVQPEVLMDKAYCQFYLGRHQDSESTLVAASELVDLFPENYAILRARIAHHLDRGEEAIASIEGLHGRGYLTAESAGLLSLLLFEADSDANRALDMANVALQKNPHMLEALLARSSLYLEMGAYDQAQADVSVAVYGQPTSGRAWSHLALCEFNSFRFAEAKEAAENAVIHMNNHIGTWHLLAWSCIMLKDYDRALWAFDQSNRLDRSFSETHGGLAYLFALQGKTELANKHIKLADKLDSQNLSANFARVMLMNHDREPSNASALLDSIKNTFNPKLNKRPQELIEQHLSAIDKQNTNSENTLKN